MYQSLGTRKLAQVAIVVRDIEKAIAQWSATLGAEPARVILTAPGGELNATYRGQPTNAQAKLAFFDLGGVQLELIEPIGEDSAWYEGLASKGEGVHHLAFWTENMAASAEALKGEGATLVHRGDMGDGQYAYFDHNDRLGVMVELLEHQRTEIK